MHKHTESPYAAPSQLSPNSRNRYSMTLGEEREIKKSGSPEPELLVENMVSIAPRDQLIKSIIRSLGAVQRERL